MRVATNVEEVVEAFFAERGIYLKPETKGRLVAILEKMIELSFQAGHRVADLCREHGYSFHEAMDIALRERGRGDVN